jgi:hypothetical protein
MTFLFVTNMYFSLTQTGLTKPCCIPSTLIHTQDVKQVIKLQIAPRNLNRRSGHLATPHFLGHQRLGPGTLTFRRVSCSCAPSSLIKASPWALRLSHSRGGFEMLLPTSVMEWARPILVATSVVSLPSCRTERW